jgi:hypothetical protein
MSNEFDANEQMHAQAIARSRAVARAQRQAQQAKTARRVSLDVRSRRPTRLADLGAVLVVSACLAIPLLFDALMR